MVRLYHYTSKHGLTAIKREERIRASRQEEGSAPTRDCQYGEGVYLTRLDPNQHSKEEVAKNNYAGGWQSRLGDGNLDCYVEVEMDALDPHLKKCQVHGRDVYLYDGDLILRGMQWDCGKNEEWTYSEILGAAVLGGLAIGGLALLGKVVWDAYNSPKEEEAKKKNSSNYRN